VTPNHNLQSPAIKAGLEEYKPESCKDNKCTLFFTEVYLAYTYDIVLVHQDGNTEDRAFLPLWKSIMVDSDFDIWGMHCVPWLKERHPDLRGLEMNG